MNKKDIIRKLEVDLANANHLVKNNLVSTESREKLQTVINYITATLEWIQQEKLV